MGSRDIEESNIGAGAAGGVARLLRCVVDATYIAPLRKVVPIEVWRWVVCGVGNYIVLDSLIYFLLYHYVVAERFLDLQMVVISPHILSLIILFPITFFTGFWLNRNVAFRATEQLAHNQLWRYGVTVVGSIVLNYVAMKFLIEGFDLWPTPSKVFTSLLTSLYSYLASRYFTFRSACRTGR